MKPQLFGAMGIGLGLLAFMTGLLLVGGPPGDRSVLGIILLIAGAVVFGSGLIASAISAAIRASK